MSSATAKKPPVPGTATARRQSTNPTATTPARSPSRISTQNGTGAATPPTVSRRQSVKPGVPLSARAAARKPAATNDADSEAKAEMQVKMEELQEQLRLAEESSADVQKQAAVLQVKLDEALKEQGNLEENVHEHTERINDLENEKKESLRARREMEQIYESERAAFMKEREETQTKEDEMQASLQRLKETLAQREMRAGLDDSNKPNMSRNSSFRNSMSSSPNPDAGQFAPPSVQRSDSSSRNNSKLVMQKDKVIEGLRLELAEAQIRLVEMENMGGGRLQKMENEMYDVKVQNARLMEENESFQLLLSEKTLNGDFSNSEFLRPQSNAGSRPSSSSRPRGNTLADELGSEDDADVNEDVRKLQNEVAAAKDQNKALTLYINNIISRLLQHDQFEQILDKTPDLMSGPPTARPAPNTEKALPPPPPEKDEEPAGLLQRARSVIGGKKPRPQSQIITSDQAPRVTENPDTAPRVSLTDRRSMSGHRRANSEWAAASVVNNMYRGPSPGNMAPGSPGLGSPTQRPVSYFGAAPLGARMPSGGRMPSGNSVPTIAEVTASTPGQEMPAGAGPTSAPNLNSVVLLLKSLGINDLITFDFMDPPSPDMLIRSLEQLYALGALNDKGELTKIGRQMAEFPTDPMLAKAVLAADKEGCVDEVLSIVAMLGEASALFYRPKDKKMQADAARNRFTIKEGGDHLTYLNIWNQWVDSDFSYVWAKENFLQQRSLTRARDVRDQLLKLCDRVEVVPSSCGASNIQPIQKAITAGFFPNAARLQRSGDTYRTVKNNMTVHLHPSGVLQESKPKWVIFFELVLTSKEFMRSVMPLQPEWLTEVAPHYYKPKDVEALGVDKKMPKGKF